MSAVGEGYHEDVVRAFFRYKVGDIGSLLSHVMEHTRKSAYELGRSLSATLPEANRIVLVGNSEAVCTVLRLTQYLFYW